MSNHTDLIRSKKQSRHRRETEAAFLFGMTTAATGKKKKRRVGMNEVSKTLNKISGL